MLAAGYVKAPIGIILFYKFTNMIDQCREHKTISNYRIFIFKVSSKRNPNHIPTDFSSCLFIVIFSQKKTMN